MPSIIKQITLAAVVVAVTAACSSTGESEATGETPAPADVEAIAETSPDMTPEPEDTPEPSPTPEQTQPAEQAHPAEPRTSQRGNIIKELGETAGMVQNPGDTIDDAWLQFQVDGIDVDGECTAEFAEAAENGTMIIVSMSISTGTDWPADMQGMTVDFLPGDWSIIGADGLTESALDTVAAAMCLADGERLPDRGVGPGENVVGKLALDSGNAEGVLVYRPWWGGGGTGWEWEF